MTDIPEEAVQAAVDALARRDFPDKTLTGYARAVLMAALPALTVREEEARADERRKTVEQIAAALLTVDPVEWALAGQHAGHDAARIARRIGEARADG